MSNKKSIALKRAARIGRRLIHPFYSDRAFLTNRFTKMKGVAPNLDNPETFSEKLLYLNLHYRNPLETLCADKYYVAEYVRACELDHILKKNYGVYQSATQIDFDALPDEFFIKCNHLSGNNMIVRKSEKPDYEYIRRFYAEMLKMNFYYFHREYCYKAIRPLIICEECLKDSKGNLPVDYKFYCFDGEPKYFMVSYGEYEHKVRNHKFDMELNSVDYHFKKESTLPQEEVVLPENFEELVSVVKKLCKPFPHVRVDMYDVDGRIVFGELTFSSNGGVVNVYDKEYDKVIVEGDHSAFVKGSFFILILMLFDYSEKDKQLLQLFSLLGTIAMAFYMIFNSAGTYALQFSNRITLAIGDSVTEVNYLSFLLIIPTGYAISSILNQETNKFLKVLYGISVLLLLYILLFTGSRAGILSIIGTAFFSVIMTLFKSRRIQPRAFLAFFILGIVVIVVAPMIYEQLPETIVRRISIQNFLLATSGANGRVDIWKRALDTMRADNSVFHMFFGNGFLSAQVTFGLTLHNLFIQVLFEQGLVGIVTLIILFYRIIRDSIATKNVMVLSETIGVLILCMSLAGVISRFFWICLAMLIICSRPNRTSEEEEYAYYSGN